MKKPKGFWVICENLCFVGRKISQGQAHFIGQCLYSITSLGVADVVGDETLSVKEICERLGGSAREESLQRCLRLLAQNGPLGGCFLQQTVVIELYLFA